MNTEQAQYLLCSSHLLTAAARIPMLLSLGGIEEWPGFIDTLSFTVAKPFSDIPILQIHITQHKTRSPLQFNKRHVYFDARLGLFTKPKLWCTVHAKLFHGVCQVLTEQQVHQDHWWHHPVQPGPRLGQTTAAHLCLSAHELCSLLPCNHWPLKQDSRFRHSDMVIWFFHKFEMH